MRMTRLLAALFAGLLPASTALAAPAPASCDLAQIKGAAELHEVLSRRAVEVVDRAARRSWSTDDRLAALVASSAEFSLGAGDVDAPLGSGVVGARKFAHAMKAEAFRFTGWDYMDMPVDACGEGKVKVDFDTGGRRTARVEFVFSAGRVASVKGWSWSLESGPVAQVDGED